MTTTREAALEAALTAMLQSVCGPTGFAEAVRHNSGKAYPWHSLEAAEAQAHTALATPATEPQGLAHIVDYTNWRGETARRVIRPIRMWWGKTEWHPDEQWMLTAWDCEKNAVRDFAWQDMRPVQNPATSAAALAARPAPQPAADTRVVGPQCCMCGKLDLSTVEDDGGTECELHDGRWVCSSDCYDRAIIGTAQPDKIAEAARDKTAAELVIDAYDAANLFREADMHPALCHCNRCAIDWMRALAGQGETP